MSFTIDQKIGKYIYVYEVESYWDSEKKQPRQRRKYIGKRDPETGEIVNPKRGYVPKVSKDFGHVYLVRQIIKKIGLDTVVKEVFSDIYNELIGLSIYEVLENKPLYLYRLWAEASYLEEGVVLSSQKISRLLEELGEREESHNEFFKLWLTRQRDVKAIIFDITSLSSYSKLIEYLEWGYNRDGERLPQINLGMIVGQPSELPIAYRVYPGSIADVTTLKNIIVLIDYLGIGDFTFILDRGFYSAMNIKEMEDEGIRFVIPLSFSTKIASGLISKNLKALNSPLQGFYHKNRPMFHVRNEIKIGDVLVYAHIYHDEKRKADEIEHLMRRIVEIEERFNEREFYSKELAIEYLEKTFPRSRNLFEIEWRDNGFKLKRKGKAISRLINRMGKTILLTNNPDLDREDLLNLYRRKDIVEKMFDIIKNELEGNRLKVSSRKVMEGRLFLLYLSIIIDSELSKIMKVSVKKTACLKK